MGGVISNQPGGYRIISIAKDGPSDKSNLEIFFDFIVDIEGHDLCYFQSETNNTFLQTILEFKGTSLHLIVFNIRTRYFRDVYITPETEDGKLQLGIMVNYEKIESSMSQGIRVLAVHDDSPSKISGIISYKDFIIASHKNLIKTAADLIEYTNANHNKQISLWIYNSNTENLRCVNLTPNLNWGGNTSIGCDVGTGYLNSIPLSRTANITDINIEKKTPKLSSSSSLFSNPFSNKGITSKIAPSTNLNFSMKIEAPVNLSNDSISTQVSEANTKYNSSNSFSHINNNTFKNSEPSYPINEPENVLYTQDKKEENLNSHPPLPNQANPSIENNSSNSQISVDLNNNCDQNLIQNPQIQFEYNQVNILYQKDPVQQINETPYNTETINYTSNYDSHQEAKLDNNEHYNVNNTIPQAPIKEISSFNDQQNYNFNEMPIQITEKQNDNSDINFDSRSNLYNQTNTAFQEPISKIQNDKSIYQNDFQNNPNLFNQETYFQLNPQAKIENSSII